MTEFVGIAGQFVEAFVGIRDELAVIGVTIKDSKHPETGEPVTSRKVQA